MARHGIRASLPEPFRIGLRPLGDEPWLRVDATVDARLAHKRARLERDRASVYRCVPGHEGVETEVLSHVARWLADHRGRPFDALSAEADDPPSPPRSGRADEDPSPLCRAALRVVEDLAVMSRTERGWTLVAACVASPSVWRLADKIGRPLGEVHAPVPGFASGTRADALIERMFDALRTDAPVVRGNWSLHATDRLYLPRHAPDHAERLARTPFERLWFRHERQTLSKLPDSGDVLFTIDVTLRRVGALDATTRERLVEQLDALAPEQRAYRGLTALRSPDERS